jgi:N-acetylglutamate synthase-like GNAT family acetyltransferase
LVYWRKNKVFVEKKTNNQQIDMKSLIFNQLQLKNTLICGMALKIIDYNSEQYHQMVALRTEVLRKPLGLTYNPSDLEKEKDDILIGAFEEDRILGCCILTRLDEKTCKLRQMAVHPSMQRNGMGASIMNFAENVARDTGYSKMVLNARKTAAEFYEKLGYQVSTGEFIEVNLPHLGMIKSIF